MSFHVLDVGCGNAGLAKGDVNVDFFREGRNLQVGVQSQGEFVEPKRIKNFVVADACYLPFKNGSFELVYSSHTIEHVLKPELMLGEMYRVAKNKVVVRCPHRKGKGAKRPFHLYYFDESWFKGAAAKLGFNEPVCFVNGLQAFIDFPVKSLDKTLLGKAFRFVQVKLGLKRPFEVEVWINKKKNVRVNDMVKFVSVFNNNKILSKCLLNSQVSLSDVSLFENTVGIGLPVFFNNYVSKATEDFWIAFCHQDFILNSNLRLVMAGKDANAVYGVAGVKVGSTVQYGKIVQSNGVPLGITLKKVEPVQTLDEMCLIVHNSLFRKGLRFDERFKFHFYGADLCLQAYASGFNVFAIQVDCQHKSRTLRVDVTSLAYREQLSLFADKWKAFLPIKTSTVVVEKALCI